MVNRSARIWQGCSASVSALMVGSPLNRGERFQVALREGADHRAVEHPAQHAGGVLDGFAAAAELEVVGVEKQRVAAEFADAHLEADPRAGGAFVEDHAPAAVPQRDGVGVSPRSAFISPPRAMMPRISPRVSDSMESRCFIVS